VSNVSNVEAEILKPFEIMYLLQYTLLGDTLSWMNHWEWVFVIICLRFNCMRHLSTKRTAWHGYPKTTFGLMNSTIYKRCN